MRIPNSFEKGLNRDIAFTRAGNNSLYKGLNIELTTNYERGSTLSIANTRGNKIYLTFPDTKNIYKYIPQQGTNTITLNGHSYTYSTAGGIKFIADQLKIEYAAEILGEQFKIQANNQYILIISCGIDPNPTITGGTLSTYISAETNLSCIGYGRINNKLVLYTTSRDNIEPVGNTTVGQIWLIEFDYINNTVLGTLSPTYELSLFSHMVYEEYLDWYLTHAIYNETIGRQENQFLGRQYFTDNYNYLRVANVYNPDLFAVPPDLIDVKPAFNQSIPIIQQVVDGGNIPVGSIEFAYYLKTVDGAITNYSPKSNLINLTQSGIQTAYVDFEGSATGLNSNKSVAIKIDGVDTRYDYLVLAVVEYSTKDVPLIYDVAEIAIDSSTVEYTYTGNEQKVPVTVADFVNPRVQFKTAKSITYKKNRMYVANTTTPNLFTDWDSRAYRFKSTGSSAYAQVYSKDGSYQYIDTNFQVYSENGLSVTPYTPPDSMDLVNPYNDESGTVYGTIGSTPDYNNWTINQQFKMQADGITLGGEGPNIKYKFAVHQQPADILQVPFPGQLPVGPKFYRQGQLASSFTGPTPTQVDPGVPTLNQNYMGVLGQVYPIGYPQSGNKNIYTASLFCGYPRGEVCRFGIVFVTDKGEEYETKWIADIRFPEPWENQSPNEFDLSSANSIQGPVNLNIIGLEFTIKDTTQLPANVTGFYFVRVERKAKDKTRLGQGIQLSPLRTGQAVFNFDNSSPDNINTFNDGSNTGQSLLGSNTDDNIEINGNASNCYYLGLKLPTRPFNDTFDSFTNANYGACASSWLMCQNFDSTLNFGGQNTSRLFTIKSPEHDFDLYNFDATHLKTVHFYQSIETNYFDPEFTGVQFGDLTSNPNTRVDAWWVKLTKVGYTFNHLINISKHRNVDIEDIVPASYDSYMQWDYYNIAIRPNNQNGELSGGGAKHIFGLTDTNNIFVQNTLPNYPQGQYLHRVSSMCKYNFGQYGGPWRVNRYANVYIQCNHFQPIDSINNPQVTLVFGGDTYTNFYSTMLYCFPWIESYNVPERGGVGSGLYPGYAYTDDMKGVSLVFPCEATINTEMRYGTYWNKSQLPTFNSTKFASFQFDEFLYNLAYTQQNNIKSFISRPVNFRPSEEQPNLTWASNNKLDGENIDQWRIFPINQYLPAEGVYGPINKILNFKDYLFVYQDRAISILNSQQVSSVPTTDGASFTVGLGNLLSFYDYTTGSVKTGTQHQFSVVIGSDTIYHWDARLQKLFMYSGSPVPFSDIKGLSGYFRGISRGIITNVDKPLLRVGVHGGYDTKYNKAYFTFSNKISIACIPYSPITQTFEIVTPLFDVLQDLFVTGDEVSVSPIDNSFPDNTTGIITIDLDNQKAYLKLINVIGDIDNFRADAYFQHTISYNKLLDCFESEHSFKPTLYVATDEQFISANPFDINNTLWLHNVGNYGDFYNQVYPWNFEFIVTTTGEANEETSRVDYVEFWSQILDFNNKSVNVTPIDSIVFENDYQSTVNSLTSLSLNQNIKKFERTFRVNEVYDYLATGSIKPYLRDKYVRITAGNTNINNYKYIINSWGTNVTNSYH